MLAKPLLSVILLLFILSATHAQTINSKVSMVDAAGKAYTGVITAINGDKYYVKYDGFEFSAWLTRDQFTIPEVKQAPAAPKAGGGAPNFDYLADREIVDCTIEQEQVKPTAAPQPALLRKLIQCLFERKAPAGMTGAKTMDISAFQIGTARKWRPLEDIGSGNLKTMVYPVKVSWTEKTFYETYTQQIDNISMFQCYVNAVGEWECSLAQRIKESEIKRIPRK